MGDPVWAPSTFSKKRERLLEGDGRPLLPRPSPGAGPRARAAARRALQGGQDLERSVGWAEALHTPGRGAPRAAARRFGSPQHRLLRRAAHQRQPCFDHHFRGPLYKKAQGQEPKLADKNYDTHDFVRELRPLQVIPPVAQHTTRRSSAIAGHTTRHPGSAVSQRERKCVAESFGWIKTVGL